jgi:hypothetical protein
MHSGQIEIAPRTIDRRALRLANVRTLKGLKCQVHRKQRLDLFIAQDQHTNYSFPASIESYINLQN